MISHLLPLLLFTAWGAVWWRLRGGALTGLTGWNPGTDGARGLCCLALGQAMILCFGFGWSWLALTLFLGLLIGGWGPFQGMGLPAPGGVPEASWLRWLPTHLGLKVGTFWHDFVGMTESGTLTMGPSFLLYLFLHHHCYWTVFLAGLLFAPCYALARITPWVLTARGYTYAGGQVWGEVYVGAVVGAALYLAGSGLT